MAHGTLANWTDSNRKKLVWRLRQTVTPSGTAEERLFEALVQRMLDREPSSSRDGEMAITTDQALKILRVENEDRSQVYQAAFRLGVLIENASKLLDPNPGAYITRAPYRIEATADPSVFDTSFSAPCIGLILADAADWFVGDVMKGIVQMCQGRYDVLVEISNYSQQAEAKSINRLAKRVSGLLVIPVSNNVEDTAIESLLKVPCVLIDRYFENMRDLPCVHPADKAAGKFAAKYLEGKGCKRILVVDQGARDSTQFSITPLKERQDGCARMAKEGFEVKILSQIGTDEEGGFEALKRFERLDEIREGDGIFALADHVAVGCHSYLNANHKGLIVPLISVEGHRFGDYTEPPLTSIKFNNFEMGRLAAEILISKIEDKALPHAATLPHTVIPPRLFAPSSGPSRREETLIPVD